VSDYDDLKRDAAALANDAGSVGVLMRLAAFAVDMLPFLDPAPVTEEALRAEGLTKRASSPMVGFYAADYLLDGNVELYRSGKCYYHNTEIKTMGQLRHLLAAMKGGG
jgi:hypothetical protein